MCSLGAPCGRPEAVGTIRAVRRLLGPLLVSAFVLNGTSARAAEGLDIDKWLRRPGVKLVAVEVFANWCGPCKAAVPRWKALHEKYASSGLRLIVIASEDPSACANPGGWNPDEIVCDTKGNITKALGVDKLPAAFLWSWQGKLLVKKGHIEQVDAAIQKWMAGSQRLAVETAKPPRAAGIDGTALRDLIRAELRRGNKLTVVATDEERAALARLKKQSFDARFKQGSQCKVGEELAANSLLESSIQKSGSRHQLSLRLLSVEKGCLSASSVVRWNPKEPQASVAEGVAELLGKLRWRAEMPWGAKKRAMRGSGPTLRAPSLGDVPEVEMPEEFEASDVEVDFASVDVAELRAYDETVRADKDANIAPEEKLKRWKKLGKRKKFRDVAKKRVAAWRDYIREKKKADAARKKADEKRRAFEAKRTADWKKLQELLKLSVVDAKKKKAWKKSFLDTYGRDPAQNPYALDLQFDLGERTIAAVPPMRMEYDRRRTRLRPRVRRLLLTEISNLERLYKSTKKNSRDRPQLIRRLAEGYVELEASAFRDKVEAEVRAQQHRDTDPNRAAKYKKKAASAKKVIKVARKSAIKFYKRFVKQYPAEQYAAEAMFYLALEYLAAGSVDKARQTLLELTEKKKKSQWLPFAYFVFGELFYMEALRDPSKFAVANKFYAEVRKYPDNFCTPLATYKLAHVLWRTGSQKKAFEMLQEARGMAKGRSDHRGLVKSIDRELKAFRSPI